MVVNLEGIDASARESVGRDIDRNDGRAALISDDIVNGHVPRVAQRSDPIIGTRERESIRLDEFHATICHCIVSLTLV